MAMTHACHQWICYRVFRCAVPVIRRLGAFMLLLVPDCFLLSFAGRIYTSTLDYTP